VTVPAQARRFSGWSSERDAWVFGLTPGAALVLGAAVMLVLLPLAGQHFARLLLTVPLAAVLAVGVLTRVAGYSALAWTRLAVRHELAGLRQETIFQSTNGDALMLGNATGTTAPEPAAGAATDLPGPLGGLAFHTATVDALPVGIAHNPGARQWTATARLVHPGLSLGDEASANSGVELWGAFLAQQGVEDGPWSRLSVLIRSVPDDGTELAYWTARNVRPDAPAGPLATVHELLASTATASVRHEAFLTVAMNERTVRKAVRIAGGPQAISGAQVVAAELSGLREHLVGAGFTDVTWLDAPALAEVIRVGFDPAEQALLEDLRLSGADPGYDGLAVGVPAVLAGPVAAVSSRGAYCHDSATSVTLQVLPSRRPVTAGVLRPLLRVGRRPGERRSLTIVYEPLSPSRAEKATSDAITRKDVAIETPRSKGFRPRRRLVREREEIKIREDALVSGHAMLRFRILLTVTVPHQASVEASVQGAQGDARNAHLQLRRLWFAQDSAFYAAALPLALGLPSMRTSRT